MITIIHGDDIVSSRKHFVDEKEKVKNPFLLDGEKVAISDIVQIFEGGGLFSETKNVYIEGFFTKRKIGIEFKEIISLIEKNSKNTQVFFWEGKELTRSQLTSFKNPTIKVFKYPQLLFGFLDSIKPGNGKNLVIGFHQLLETMEIELIFYMLIRQFRLLLALYSNCHPEHSEGSRDSSPAAQNDNHTIDEVVRLAPWQKSKLQRQAQSFSLGTLKLIYNRFYEIDLAQKTGNLNLSLKQSIDIFLINL